MERYGKQQAQRAFERLAAALGKPFSPAVPAWRHVDGKNVATVGVWFLDSAPVYGGYVIGEMHNEGGGENRPLGNTRQPARQFCESVAFALDVLRQADPKGHERRMSAYFSGKHYQGTWGKHDAKRMARVA